MRKYEFDLLQVRVTFPYVALTVLRSPHLAGLAGVFFCNTGGEILLREESMAMLLLRRRNKTLLQIKIIFLHRGGSPILSACRNGCSGKVKRYDLKWDVLFLEHCCGEFGGR